ncbi:hypothetical protein ACJJTC_013029 [Scirpophaga incertulas]
MTVIGKANDPGEIPVTLELFYYEINQSAIAHVSLYIHYTKFKVFEVDTNDYYRRIKQFTALNNMVKELYVATLVTHVGVNSYELMCDLCAPHLPESKAFDELVRIVKQHLEPKRSEIAERHIFRHRKQMAGETVNNF